MSSTRQHPRHLTGLTPSGHLHVGNLLAAIIPIVRRQGSDAQVIAFLADLSSLTVEHDPRAVTALTRQQGAILLAAGLDPDRSIVFVQSQVPELTALHFLLESTASYGEAARMIQFKEKARRAGDVGARLSLLTYPALMAADILLYGANEVPVGNDQNQHLEFARDVATRFNRRYGETFVIPRAVLPAVGARVMDLADPTAKMSKSTESGAGVLYVLDPPEVIRRKVRRAVTGPGGEGVSYAPETAPGAANLLDLFALATGADPRELADRYSSYRALKSDLTDALVAVVEPIQRRYELIAGDVAELDRTLTRGADRARSLAAPTLARAQLAIGLLPRAEVAPALPVAASTVV